MDGLFHGKPYEQMDDLGVPLFLETPKKKCINSVNATDWRVVVITPGGNREFLVGD